MGYKTYLMPRLGDASRYHRFIFEAAEDSDNVLSIDSIRSMFVARSKLAEVAAEHHGTAVRLPDLCWKGASGTSLPEY
jgi:hypothetical protein